MTWENSWHVGGITNERTFVAKGGGRAMGKDFRVVAGGSDAFTSPLFKNHRACTTTRYGGREGVHINR